MYLRCTDSGEQTRFRLPLVVTARTVGVHTGWVRLVAETSERVLTLELRVKQGETIDWELQLGNVDGRDPESVLNECETLLTIEDGDALSLEFGIGQSLIRLTVMGLPGALESLYHPIAQCLTDLQPYAALLLVLPSVSQVSDEQLACISLLTSIYGGTPHRWSWTELKLAVPDDSGKAEEMRATVAMAAAGEGAIVMVDEPEFELGNRTYSINHPLASTTHSLQLDPLVDPAALAAGDAIRLIPGGDDSVTTAMIADWTPGSIQLG